MKQTGQPNSSSANPRRVIRPWSTWERKLLGQYRQDLRAGRYESVAAASRHFLERRAREQPDLPPRAARAVGIAIRRGSGERGLPGHGAPFTLEEDTIIRRYVQALLDRRYHTVVEAAKPCRRELERWLRRLPQSSRGVPRHLRSIGSRLHRLALQAGYRRYTWRFTPEENEILDRYARRLARLRDVLGFDRISAECRRALEASNRQRGTIPPGARPLHSVRLHLSRRAHALGWSWREHLWQPEERRIMNRYVRRLTGSGATSIRQAARECRAELGRLWRQGPPGRFRVRTRKTVETYLLRWTRQSGRPVFVRWTAHEDAIAMRYARALVAGKYLNATAAAVPCRRALLRLRGAAGQGRGGKGERPRPRSAIPIAQYLSELGRRSGRTWPGLDWTPAELKLCRAWLPWYVKYRRVRRMRALITAGEGLQDGLAKIGYRRSFAACKNRVYLESKRDSGA